MLAPVYKHHDEVRIIQPTWHCLLRFRQRVKVDKGADAATAALHDSLERAHLTRMPPGWVASRDQPTAIWAVDGDLVYPLTPGAGGAWTAATVLRKGGR